MFYWSVDCGGVSLQRRTHFSVLFIHSAQLTAANPSIPSAPPDPLMSTSVRTHRHPALIIEWAGSAVMTQSKPANRAASVEFALNAEVLLVQTERWTNGRGCACACAFTPEGAFMATCGEVKTYKLNHSKLQTRQNMEKNKHRSERNTRILFTAQ